MQYVLYRRVLRRKLELALAGEWEDALTDLILDLAVAEPEFSAYGLGGQMGQLMFERVVAVDRRRCSCRRRCRCRAGVRLHTSVRLRENVGATSEGRGPARSPEWRMLVWRHSVHDLIMCHAPTYVVEAGGRVYLTNAASVYVMDAGAAATASPGDDGRAEAAAAASPLCNCVLTDKASTGEPEPPATSGWRLCSRFPWPYREPVPVVVADRWILFLSGYGRAAADDEHVHITRGTLVYDTVACAWSAGPPFEEAHCLPTAIAVGSRVLALGGYGGPARSCVALDTSSRAALCGGEGRNRWRSIAPPPGVSDRPYAEAVAAYEIADGLVRVVLLDGSAYDFDSRLLPSFPTESTAAVSVDAGSDGGGDDAPAPERPRSGAGDAPLYDARHECLWSDAKQELSDSRANAAEPPTFGSIAWSEAPCGFVAEADARSKVRYFYDVAGDVHLAFETNHSPITGSVDEEARRLRAWTRGSRDLEWVPAKTLGDNMFHGVCLLRK